MPTNTNVTNLKINELTEAQYDAAVQGGVIGANELSILTDVDDAIQVATMPTAAAGEVGKVYQFIGTTDANYTHGYFYECVSDGQNPATYSWVQTNVQPAPSGLPDQTGNSGKFLTTDGTDASWSDKPLVNKATGSGSIMVAAIDMGLDNSNCTIIGSSSWARGSYCVGLGYAAHCENYAVSIGCASTADKYCVSVGYRAGQRDGSVSYYKTAIGYQATAAATGAIQLGSGTNTTAGTLQIGLTTNGSTWTQYRLLDSDGTIPTDRFTTTPSADGTYTPTVTISSGVATRSWAPAASAPVVPATMPELTVAGWSSNTQTVNVTGVTASNVVFVSPAPASAADYAAAGILCTAQSTNSLTFSCQTVPTNAITVNVVIL